MASKLQSSHFHLILKCEFIMSLFSSSFCLEIGEEVLSKVRIVYDSQSNTRYTESIQEHIVDHLKMLKGFKVTISSHCTQLYYSS